MYPKTLPQLSNFYSTEILKVIVAQLRLTL